MLAVSDIGRRDQLTPALEDEEDTVRGAVLVYSCGLTGIAVGTGGRDIVLVTLPLVFYRIELSSQQV